MLSKCQGLLINTYDECYENRKATLDILGYIRSLTIPRQLGSVESRCAFVTQKKTNRFPPLKIRGSPSTVAFVKFDRQNLSVVKARIYLFIFFTLFHLVRVSIITSCAFIYFSGENLFGGNSEPWKKCQVYTLVLFYFIIFIYFGQRVCCAVWRFFEWRHRRHSAAMRCLVLLNKDSAVSKNNDRW